ncbi:CLAVATA3/ESR (CLE)-related protein 12 [Diospyros lotus]|uniref:CLAVATA3/ESR (CLE)-related protein 12 n=1 Tax=Diospyros lotus TaxID=55363 RepID=UPI00225B7707|nr:CLAVATA3/ESR (CLE)-related protein 12 [Diospyros lotus]
MALQKPSRLVLLIVVCLSLFAISFHEVRAFSSRITSHNAAANLPLPRHPPPANRKVLENSKKFDFTPFLRNHSRKHPPESEIDPLYGVEKRLVPTGPNPLHH